MPTFRLLAVKDCAASLNRMVLPLPAQVGYGARFALVFAESAGIPVRRPKAVLTPGPE